MKEYRDKEELVNTIKETFAKYDKEFIDIPEALKDKKIYSVDRSPAENLAYQIGWLTLLLRWEKEELEGKKVHTPCEGYKWNNLGSLYESFNQKYIVGTLQEQRAVVSNLVYWVCDWILSLEEKELFETGQRKWADNAAKWPLYKWIHINTVAPFTNFRLKIRKWKKEVL